MARSKSLKGLTLDKVGRICEIEMPGGKTAGLVLCVFALTAEVFLDGKVEFIPLELIGDVLDDDIDVSEMVDEAAENIVEDDDADDEDSDEEEKPRKKPKSKKKNVEDDEDEDSDDADDDESDDSDDEDEDDAEELELSVGDKIRFRVPTGKRGKPPTFTGVVKKIAKSKEYAMVKSSSAFNGVDKVPAENIVEVL